MLVCIVVAVMMERLKLVGNCLLACVYLNAYLYAKCKHAEATQLIVITKYGQIAFTSL